MTGPPKTARGRRTLPIDPPLAAALRHTRSATVAALGPDRWVAVDQAGQPYRPEAFSDLFVDLATEARLPVIRLHDLRDTALSLLLARGVPVHVVARFAGHDPAITLRTYAHVTPDALGAASEVFGSAFGVR